MPHKFLQVLREDIRRRRFDTEPVRLAVESDRIHVRSAVSDDLNERAEVIAEEVRRLRVDGHETFGIYAKTNADVSSLSTALNACRCSHVPIGFGEAFGECLSAMLTMTSFRSGRC